MKKTLVALMALAGVTMAETVVFDFGRTDNDAYMTSGAITLGTNGNRYHTGIQGSGLLGNIEGNYSYVQEDCTKTNYGNSATLSNGEEANWKEHLHTTPTGWDSTFADGLTCQVGSTHTLTLSNLTSGYYDLSILGGFYGNDNIVPSITLSLGGNSVDFSETVWSSYDIAGGTEYSAQGVSTYTTALTNGSADEGYTYDIQKIFVENGGSITITLTGANENDGQRTPLNGLKLTWTPVVPEPTTATLSLLALAGLAARRRRK